MFIKIIFIAIVLVKILNIVEGGFIEDFLIKKEAKGSLRDIINQGKEKLNICEIETIENSAAEDRLNFYIVLNKTKEDVKKCTGTSSNLNSTLCKFTRPGNHSNDEILYNDGANIGLKEIGEEMKPAEVILRDQKLLAEGADEMRRQLIDLSLNGNALRRVLVVGESSQYFTNKSGFVLSNIRFLRAFYCVQKLALIIQRKYRIQFGDSAAHKIVEAMKTVERIKVHIKEALNGNSVFTINRMEISKEIENVGKLENELIDENGRLGSSMALVGYFALNKNQLNDKFSKCGRNSAQCISYFHISARNDSKFVLEDPDLEDNKDKKN